MAATTFDQVYEEVAHRAKSHKISGGDDLANLANDPTSRFVGGEGESSPATGEEVAQLKSTVRDLQNRLNAQQQQVAQRVAQQVAQKVAEADQRVADAEQTVMDAVQDELQTQLTSFVETMSGQITNAESQVRAATTRLRAGGQLEHIASRVLSVAPHAETKARAGMEGMRVVLDALSKESPSLQGLHDVWVGLQAEHAAELSAKLSAAELSAATRSATRSPPSPELSPKPPLAAGAVVSPAAASPPVVGLVPMVTQLIEEHDAARRTGDARRAALARATFEEHLWKATGARHALPPFAWE